MFWTDWGASPKIERGSMDGEERITIATSGLTLPNCIAIDFQEDRLYWIDASYDKIEVADYDGSNRQQLYQEGGIHPFGIQVFKNSLYWTDNGNARIVEVEKADGTVLNSLSTPVRPCRLVVVDGSSQPSGEDSLSHNTGSRASFYLWREVAKRITTHFCLPGRFLCAAVKR